MEPIMIEEKKTKEQIIEYWCKRAEELAGTLKVTHQDIYQKKIETEILDTLIDPYMQALEVGCGDGYVTEFLSNRVLTVDAFDASPQMIELAKKRLALKSNCYLWQDELPRPSHTPKSKYDLVVSVRVLINLPTTYQHLALDWIASKVKTGGRFVLIEGSADGIANLNRVREQCRIPDIEVPEYNYNIHRDWLMPILKRDFKIVSEHNTGTYDYLTRVFYPQYVGKDNIEYNTGFHVAAYELPNVEGLDEFSRLIILCLEKK